MVNILNRIIFISFVVLVSCKSAQIDNNQVKNDKNLYQKTLYLVENDAIFLNKIKQVYTDFKNCENLNFLLSSSTEFVTIDYFEKEELKHTKYFKDCDKLNYLDFSNKKEKFDSMMNKEKKHVEIKSSFNNSNCRMNLTFSNINQNIIIVEYKVIDENIDPLIDYTPRKGYYLVEFDKNGEVKYKSSRILIN